MCFSIIFSLTYIFSSTLTNSVDVACRCAVFYAYIDHANTAYAVHMRQIKSIFLAHLPYPGSSWLIRKIYPIPPSIGCTSFHSCSLLFLHLLSLNIAWRKRSNSGSSISFTSKEWGAHRHFLRLPSRWTTFHVNDSIYYASYRSRLIRKSCFYRGASAPKRI